MAHAQSWKINVEGEDYLVELTPSNLMNKHLVTVNGVPQELRQSFLQAFTGMDQPILLGEKEVRFVLIENVADIAVDGVFVDSKKPYQPLSTPPWWEWIFVVLSFALAVAGGLTAVAFLLALISALYSIRASVSPKTPPRYRPLVCLAITAGAWAIYIALMYFL